LARQPEDGGNVRDHHETIKELEKATILNKIKEREDMSGYALKSTIKGLYNADKEKLIDKNASKTFYLHEDNNDWKKEKTMEKYNAKQVSMSSSMKFIGKEKPEVMQYYEKCVEKYDAPNKFENFKNDLIPSRSQYNAQLKDQLISQAEAKEKK